MTLTQAQIAQQMVAQLRVLDPSVSAEVGTPERKIIDTVAQAIAEAQVDLNLLGGSLSLDTKYGTDLENFVGLFGFGRQQGAYAAGFVTFSRQSPSAYNITVPRGTQVSATVSTANGTITVVFQTTLAVTLVAGGTSIIAPVQALQPGVTGNVAVNTITQFANVGSPPLGITTVTNTLATTNGSDSETDAELKVRFRNTVFRNLSGTEDQFMAVAVSGAFSTKANVIGPISRYQEYMQIPSADDASPETGEVVGNGNAGWWTTTPSNNPYAQYIYTTIPYFASNGAQSTSTVFYQQDFDFVMNAPPLNFGDTYREATEGDLPAPATTPTKPNFTFFNVYTGTDTTVQRPRPNDVVLVEYAYLSAESRNDLIHNITNCVDVYVNGENDQTGTTVTAPPRSNQNLFTTTTGAKFNINNFRRLGQPDVTPTVNNIFMALYWQPVTAVPSQISVGNYTYLLGIHYYGVEDVTVLRNTVRSRNGIEWVATMNGMNTGDPVVVVWTAGHDWNQHAYTYYNGTFYTANANLTSDQTPPSSDPTNWTTTFSPFTGPVITGSVGVTSFTISGYAYDRNVVDLQAAMDGVKQVTTDVLVHRATPHYFKLDLTVVYSSGVGVTTTNASIQTALANYFDGQYFGSIIQLSDILLTVRNVPGVQNVRWTSDVLNPSDDSTNLIHRVTECDVYGNPRSPAVVYDTDFTLRDSELPQFPTGSVSGDTLPGLLLRQRSQNTFNLV